MIETIMDFFAGISMGFTITFIPGIIGLFFLIRLIDEDIKKRKFRMKASTWIAYHHPNLYKQWYDYNKKMDKVEEEIKKTSKMIKGKYRYSYEQITRENSKNSKSVK